MAVENDETFVLHAPGAVFGGLPARVEKTDPTTDHLLRVALTEYPALMAGYPPPNAYGRSSPLRRLRVDSPQLFLYRRPAQTIPHRAPRDLLFHELDGRP